MTQSPTATRLLLGTGLRKLRERWGWNTTQAATVLGLKQLSTYRRYEHGQIKIPLPHLKVLLAEWEATDEERQLLFELQEQADQEGWWPKYWLNDSMNRLLGFEEVTTHLRVFESTVVYGPLQTERYARTLLRAAEPELADDALERVVKLRANRREHLLKRPDSPRMEFILDESVLRRNVGGPAVMREQLATLAGLPRAMDLRILPLSTTGHPGFIGSFFLMVFPPELRKPALYFEGMRRNFYLDTDDDVERASADFGRLWNAALSRDASRELILTVMEEWSR